MDEPMEWSPGAIFLTVDTWVRRRLWLWMTWCTLCSASWRTSCRIWKLGERGNRKKTEWVLQGPAVSLVPQLAFEFGPKLFCFCFLVVKAESKPLCLRLSGDENYATEADLQGWPLSLELNFSRYLLHRSTHKGLRNAASRVVLNCDFRKDTETHIK